MTGVGLHLLREGNDTYQIYLAVAKITTTGSITYTFGLPNENG